MAMRPHVKRNGWFIIAFAVIQCIVLQTAVHQQWLDLNYSQRAADENASCIRSRLKSVSLQQRQKKAA